MTKRKLPLIKKNIRSFLNSEEGKITKKSAFQLGLSIGMIGVFAGQITHVEAGCWPPPNHTSHSSGCQNDNVFYDSSYDGDNPCPSDNTSYTPSGDTSYTPSGDTSYTPSGDTSYDSGVKVGDFNGYDTPYFSEYLGSVKGVCPQDNAWYNLTAGPCPIDFTGVFGTEGCPSYFNGVCGGDYNGVYGSEYSGYYGDCPLDFSGNLTDNPCPSYFDYEY